MSLVDQFHEYELLEGASNDALWSRATVALDTNVLLSLLRLTVDSYSEVLGLFEAVGERLWIPHNVGLEFMRNRRKVILELLDAPTKLRDALIRDLEQISHPLLPLQDMRTAIEGWFVEYDPNRVSSGRKHAESELENRCKRIGEFFGPRCGAKYGSERLKEIYAAGKVRYAEGTPPGFADQKNKSKDEELYGDLVIWHQLIDYAKQKKKDVLFVTRDVKTDWWWIERGATLGPHYKLRREFRSETAQTYYSYNLELFLTYAGTQFMGRPINPNVFSELNRYRSAELAREGTARPTTGRDDPADGLVAEIP